MRSALLVDAEREVADSLNHLPGPAIVNTVKFLSSLSVSYQFGGALSAAMQQVACQAPNMAFLLNSGAVTF